VRKVALGAALAVMLAALPVTLFATAASASASNVHIIYTSNSNQQRRIFISGVAGNWLQAPNTAFDISLSPGTYTVGACDTAAASMLVSAGNALCLDAANNIMGPIDTGFVNNVVIPSGDSNYTVTLQHDSTDVYQLDNAPTANGMARLQVNNSDFAAPVPNFDVCVNNQQVLNDIATHTSKSVELPAQQNAVLTIGFAGCNGNAPTINLVAGTNAVFTLVDHENEGQANCTDACVQYLFVGQGAVTSTSSTSGFCVAIVDLSTVKASLKDLIGNVDPADTSTYPGANEVKAWADDTSAKLYAGDVNVTPDIAGDWATATAGLRSLIQALQVVGYDMTKLPVATVDALVHQANGQTLPGVPVDQNVVNANAALAAWYPANCGGTSSTTPAATATATAAAPVAAAAKFTG